MANTYEQDLVNLMEFCCLNGRSDDDLEKAVDAHVYALRTDLDATDEALRPFAAAVPEPSQGLDSMGDDTEVELWLFVAGQKVRFGFLKLGDLRRAAEAKGE